MVVMFSTNSFVQANESPSHASSKFHKLDSTELNKVRLKSEFKLLVPGNIPDNWTVELKVPYPFDSTRTIQNVRLHYFDKDENYMFGIEQHKAIGYKLIKKHTYIDVRNNTSETKDVEEDFKFDTSGDIIKFNGLEARFTPWGKSSTPGGSLRWIQEGTYIEIVSSEMSKKKMIKIAKSMK